MDQLKTEKKIKCNIHNNTDIMVLMDGVYILPLLNANEMSRYRTLKCCLILGLSVRPTPKEVCKTNATAVFSTRKFSVVYDDVVNIKVTKIFTMLTKEFTTETFYNYDMN